VAKEVCEVKVANTSAATEIHLRGVITEQFVVDVNKLPAGRPIIVDTGEVKNINSLGVRNWIRFVNSLCQRAPVTIRRLSPSLVIQVSMISNFLGEAKIESFFSPWECPHCRHWHETLHGIDEDLPSSIPCPKCGANMIFDDVPDAYLSFLTG
jgi:hypothetical protein